MNDTPADVKTPAALKFLAKGGEVGARMRALDWGATPLGDPRQWPQSLKTIVRVLLDSRYAMWMAWGPELTFFCNDAYLPTVGIKHDWVLGARAEKVWQEIWPDIGPRIRHVLQSGEATWDEGLQLFLERSGFLEETYHTFSYSPVYDDASRIAGMLCVVTEVTERVIGERRLRLLRDLATHLGGADDVTQTCHESVRVLSQYPLDIPFAALYLLRTASAELELIASTHDLDSAQLPTRVSIAAKQRPGSLAEALQALEPRQLPELCAAGVIVTAGPWPDLIEQAMVLPIGAPGQSEPAGMAVLGLSPRHAADHPYRDTVKLIVGQVASAITASQAYEAQRARAEALAEVNRAKTTFFSNVSHEFRTPLTLIAGPLEEALRADEAHLAPEIRRDLQIMQRNAERLTKLVNTLLQFSRIEAGRARASFEPLDVGSYTADLASTFRAAIERAGLRLEVDCAPIHETAYIDRNLWEQIVFNLLSNAFKFTLAGTIRVSTREIGGMLQFEVADSGSGIPQESLPRLFERFYRVPNAQGRSYEGTGIGLALVAELVKLHGGNVGVQSRMGSGSTFTVNVPLGSAHLPTDQIRQVSSDSSTVANTAALRSDASAYLLEASAEEPSFIAAAAAASQTRSGTVLLVDDNADMREYVRRLLATRFQVITAADGQEALIRARESVPDLVLSDVMMPRLDGFGLLQALRADPHLRDIPVILLSARAGEEASIEGLEAGADDYLIKPFTTRELLARVSTHLNMARARGEAHRLKQRTEQMRREALEAINRQLTLETESLRRLFEQSTGFAAVLRGPELIFELANTAFFDLIGQRAIIGRPLREALPEIEQQPLPQLQWLEQVLSSGRAYVGRSMRVQLQRHPEAALEDRYIDAVYQPLLDSTGAVSGIFLQGSDVTEHTLAAQELKAATQRLTETDRRKDEFLAMLAHELRNPLAPIQNASELLARMHPADSSGQHLAGIVRRQVKQLARLVDDLLDVSRITEGRIQLDFQPVELSSVVSQALETVQPLIRERHHRVDTTSTREPLFVNADQARLVQCLANVLTNAAKYTDPCGQIGIELRAEQRSAVIEVSDNGVGMAPDLLPQVFELFVQGDRALDRSQGGLGIGLSLVQRLIEMHGGSVSAHSDGIGLGSRFQLRLPLVDSPTASPPVLQRRTTTPRRVLIVDDNADAADSLVMMLKFSEHQAQSVYSAQAALEQLQSFNPQVVLLDIGLPHMDGYEVARRIRAQGSCVFLVAVTGYGQLEDRRRAQAAGFDAHLVKPLDAAALERLLEALPPNTTRQL